MSKKWSFEQWIRSSAVRARISNHADYSPYVQGELQARFHAARGWKRADVVIDKSLDKGAEFIGKEVDKELRK